MDTPAKDTSIRYSDDDRQLAYEVWALEAGQNTEKTSAILSAQHGLSVDGRRIRDWRDRHSWETRYAAEVEAAAPMLRHRAFGILVVGSPEAAAYLRAVVTGQEQPEKTRVAAAFGILDRIGFSPVGRNTYTPDNPADRVRELADLREMTVDQLLQAEREEIGKAR